MESKGILCTLCNSTNLGTNIIIFFCVCVHILTKKNCILGNISALENILSNRKSPKVSLLNLKKKKKKKTVIIVINSICRIEERLNKSDIVIKVCAI